MVEVADMEDPLETMDPLHIFCQQREADPWRGPRWGLRAKTAPQVRPTRTAREPGHKPRPLAAVGLADVRPRSSGG